MQLKTHQVFLLEDCGNYVMKWDAISENAPIIGQAELPGVAITFVYEDVKGHWIRWDGVMYHLSGIDAAKHRKFIGLIA